MIPVNLSPLMMDNRNGVLSTCLDTSPADPALAFPDHEVWGEILRLWIGTPAASQGTTLHEDRGPNARSVMDGETLDIKNDSFFVVPIGRNSDRLT